MKQILSTDFDRWRRCLALIQLKMRERRVLRDAGDPQCSSDEVKFTVRLSGVHKCSGVTIRTSLDWPYNNANQHFAK